MSTEPLFKGLVFDEKDQLVETSTIGSEPCYVVNDDGFLRHIPSREIDLQVLNSIKSQISGNEELIADQTAKMMGQDDLFSHAIILNQLKNIDKQLDQVMEIGMPENARMYLGMTGFKVVINIHGELVQLIQPTAPASGNDDDNGEGE